jgi:nucleoside-diphosphate-sugar epimerase
MWDISAGPLRDAPAVDAVVHAAAMVDDWGSSEHFAAVNVAGTRNVLETFPRARRVVLVSSASVYGSGLDLCEDAPLPSPHNAYCATKCEAEALVLGGEDGVVLRPHAVYGPGDPHLLPRIRAACIRNTFIVPGDGTNRVSLTHVDNLVQAVTAALESHVPAGVYNVCDSADAAAIDEILATLFLRLRIDVRLMHAPARPVDAVARVLEGAFSALRLTRGPRLTRYAVSQLANDLTLDLQKSSQLLRFNPTGDFRSLAI